MCLLHFLLGSIKVFGLMLDLIFVFDRFYTLEQGQRVIFHIEEILRVIDISLIRAIYFIVRNRLLISVLVCALVFRVEQFSGQERPSEQIIVPIKRREEAVLLPPNNVRVLLAHANAIDQIEMGKGYHSKLIVIHDEREPITVLVDVDVIADSSDRRYQLVTLEFSFKEPLSVNNIKSRRLVPELALFLGAVVRRKVCDFVRSRLAVRNRVEVAAMQIATIPRVDAIIHEAHVQFLVENLDFTLGNLRVVFIILPVLF